MIFLKLFLLLLYVVLLIAVYRFADFLAWSDSAGVSTIVDPINLSLRQLRWLLHARGVSYHGAIEKKDLTDLVSVSGVVTNDEVKVAEKLESYDSYDTVTFSSKTDLLTSMDNSDDVWLVQIISEGNGLMMKDSEWKKLIKHSHVAGIRTGQVVCANTPLVCQEFSSSQLVLSNHYKKNYRGIHRKHYLTRKTDCNGAFHWISSTLKDTTEEISSVDHLKLFWFNNKFRKKYPIQLVYISELDHIPVIFSALQSKFRDSVRFGRLNLKPEIEQNKLRELLNVEVDLPKSFVCLVVDQQTFVYAADPSIGSHLHFQSLYLFLLTFNLDVNHVFTWSICICNVLASLSFITTSGNVLSRFISVVKSIFSYNAVLLCFWVLLSTYNPLPFREFTAFCLYYFQSFATTQYAEYTRQCLQLLVFRPFIVIAGFTVFFCVFFLLLKWCKIVTEDEYRDTLSELLFLNENRYPGYNDISRRWVERLATPGLWLQPLVSSDYIENLPVWKYNRKCVETSDDSDANMGPSNRNSSVSPSRNWSSCVARGRTCSSSRRVSGSFRQRILWSLRTCFRGRSPRFRRTPGPPSGMRDEHNCSVCLDNYKFDSFICGLPCGHIFHHDCILQWLHSDHHCCPICRWPAYQIKEQGER